MTSAIETAQLRDRAEIVDLHVRYARALDTRDWPLMRTVFAEDAFADFWVGGRHQGIESILTGCISIMENLDATQHVVGNHEIQIDGDRATATSYVVAGHLQKATDGEPTCTVRGTYTDEVRRTDTGWRLSRRVLTVHWSEGNLGVFAVGQQALGSAA